MKPIHNGHKWVHDHPEVVIPHKVNDFYETNSQPSGNSPLTIIGCDSSQS